MSTEPLGPPVGHVSAPPVRAADHLADELAAITVAPGSPPTPKDA